MKNWETQQHGPTHGIMGGRVGRCSVAPPGKRRAAGPRGLCPSCSPLPPCLLCPRRQGQLPRLVPCAVTQGGNSHLTCVTDDLLPLS